MNSIKKITSARFLLPVVIVQFGVLLLAFTTHKSPIAASSSRAAITDTLPQTEIVNLKRADIYVVIIDSNMVKIRLQNKDSIMMDRASFDLLPDKVKKEISAHNNGIFTKEEIESSYPGGPAGWLAYLNRTFKYPQEAVLNGIEGTVVVQFLVDDRGKVSGIEVISGPTSGGLREETIRVIERSGRWKPAIWNGYKVTSYKRQPLTFRLTR